MSRASRSAERGQMLALGAVMLTALIGVAGLVTDVGMAFFQQRVEQNAASAAAHAGTAYWAQHRNADDGTLLCLVQLYASSGMYAKTYVGSSYGCRSDSSVKDNGGLVAAPASAVKGSSGAWYVDRTGAELVSVGSLSSGTVVSTALSSAVGIRVYAAAQSPAFFSRVFGVNGYGVTGVATYRLGPTSTVNGNAPNPVVNVSVPTPGCLALAGDPCGANTPSNPNPSSWQPLGSAFPAAFQLSTYTATTLYSPTTPPPAPLPFALGQFNWSGLQCAVSHSNNVVKQFLQHVNPCPDQPSMLATSGSPVCSSPAVSCGVNVDPGVRAVDFSYIPGFVGQVVLVPIVNGASNAQPILQFAYFFVSGTTGNGVHATINGFFLDPASMPPTTSGQGIGCNPGVPCGVVGS